jgi:hypothetical protein
MGGVCSKSETKKKREETATAKDKGKAGSAAAAAPAAAPPPQLADSGADPHYPAHDPDESQGGTPSPALNENKGGADPALGSSPSSPNKLNETKQLPSKGAGSTNAACPLPSQTGEKYEEWFPPGHDAAMKLGDGKYKAVGMPSPSSDTARSAELHSVASTPSYRIPSPATSTPAAAASPSHAYNPMLFVDEDSAAPETASSAFMTPRELRGDASSVADNASLVSHGSMMSQHAHGYRYYNSSNLGDDGFLTPASSHRPSVGSTSMASRGRNTGKTAMTVTNVRTNQRMPATSSLGAATPLSRQSSRAGSDRFQSCRSIGDASTSAASYLPPISPAGGVSEREMLLLSVRQGSNYSGGRRSSLGSQLSGYPPSSPYGANFYSCRSLGMASEQSGASSLVAPLGSTTAASPTSVQRPHSFGSPFGLHNESSASLSNLRGMAPLPPRSPRGSPMGAFGNTPSAQQEFLYRQASRQSTFGDRPASEAFFSVGGSSRDVFLDLPSAADTSTVYTLDDDRDLELTLGARGTQKPNPVTPSTGGVENNEPASPASHYSSVYASSLPQNVEKLSAAAAAPDDGRGGSAGMMMESPGSPESSSASSAWLAAPACAATKMPGDRQRRATAAPPEITDDLPPTSSKGLEGGTSDYDADSSSVATSLKGSRRRKAVPVKSYYTKADFPPNKHTPPQAKVLATPAAAESSPLSLPKRAAVVGTATPASTAAVEAAMVDSTYNVSTPSETSTRKSSVAWPTMKYPSGDKEIDGDEEGDAVRPRALENAAQFLVVATEVEAPPRQTTSPPPPPQPQQPRCAMPTSSSSHSFSTVASSYRREQQQQQQGGATSPDSLPMEGPRRTKSSGAGSGGSVVPHRRAHPSGLPKRHTTARSSLQRSKVGVHTTAAAALPGPMMTNPNPWVPGGASAGATSAHADPFVLDKAGRPHPRERSVEATSAAAATPRTSGRGRGDYLPIRRSVVPTNTGAGSASIPPGRRTNTTTATASASASGTRITQTNGNARRLPKRNRLPPPVQEEAPSWAELGPSQATGSAAKPVAKPAVAAKVRKAKKASEASTLATPPPSQSIRTTTTTVESDMQPTTRRIEGGDSVVEYELFTGELADAEVESTAEDTGDVSFPGELPVALRSSPPSQQQPQRWSNHTPPAFHTAPQLRTDHPRESDSRASCDASPDVLTSAEACGFLQPYTDAQLASQMDSGEGDLVNGVWLGVTTVPTTTATTTVAREGGGGGGVVMRVDLADVPPPRGEETDEGYDADSGMPALMTTTKQTGTSLPPSLRSVSAASNEDAFVPPATSPAADADATAGTGVMETRSAMQRNGEAGESAGGNAVDLSSSSSVSDTETSVASPVTVG